MGVTSAAFVAREQLLMERVARAELLVATQRQHLHQLEAQGVDLAQAQALLKLMESVAEQFRVACGLFQAYAQRLPANAEPVAEACPSLAAISDCAGGLAERGMPEAPRPAPAMGRAQVRCPHCKIMLAIGAKNGALQYDMTEWAQRCRYPALQTPALCQLLRGEQATLH